MNNLYILKTADGNQHLLAALSKRADGYYEFKPLITSNELTPALSFPLLEKAVENGFDPTQNDIRSWIKSYTPPLDDKDLTEKLLKKKGMTEYDEWEWLKSYKPNSINTIGFYENIPEGCIRHDQDLHKQAQISSSKIIPIEVLIEACDKMRGENGEDYDVNEALAPYIDENTSVEEALGPYLDPDFEANFRNMFRSKTKAFLYDQISKNDANNKGGELTDKPVDCKSTGKPTSRKFIRKSKNRKSTGKPADHKPAYHTMKKTTTMDQFISQHSSVLISDKEVIESVYKTLAESTLSSYCSVMKNPCGAVNELERSLICFASEDQDVSVDGIQLPDLINKFVEKTGFGNVENMRYNDTTAAVYNTLIKPYNTQTKVQKG